MDQLPRLVSTISQTVAGQGSFTKDGGVVCYAQTGWKHLTKDEECSKDDNWIHLTSEKVCDKSVDCSNQMDERACFKKKMNGTEAIVLNGVGPTLAGAYTLQQ